MEGRWEEEEEDVASKDNALESLQRSLCSMMINHGFRLADSSDEYPTKLQLRTPIYFGTMEHA